MRAEAKLLHRIADLLAEVPGAAAELAFSNADHGVHVLPQRYTQLLVTVRFPHHTPQAQKLQDLFIEEITR